MTIDPETLEQARTHHQEGRLDQAEALYKRILEETPDHPETLHLMGLMAFQRGKVDIAVDRITRAIQGAPSVGKYHGNLGSILLADGRDDEAAPHLETALSLDPDNAATHNSLAVIYRERGEIARSIEACDKALSLEPDQIEARINKALALIGDRRAAEAVDIAREADGMSSDHPDVLNALALALGETGADAEALDALRRASNANPEHGIVQRNLGVRLNAAGRYAEAAEVLGLAADLWQDDPSTRRQLAQALTRTGRIEDALPHLRAATELRPDAAADRSALLSALLADSETRAAELAREHRDWDIAHGAALTSAATPHANDRNPDRPLRVGVVTSADSTAGHHVRMTLAQCDPAAMTVSTYGTSAGLADAINLSSFDDAAAAARIRDDGIDVLIDTLGHDGGNRLLVIARKPAPVQISYGGYPFTTGLASMDLFLTDPVVTPPDTDDGLFSETVVRLDGPPIAYAPPVDEPDAPDVAPGPQAEGGHVTFGAFGDAGRLTRPTLVLWARILETVPGSKLRLRAAGLQDPGTAGALKARCVEAGIAEDRLLFGGAATLDAYDGIDILLDPMPRSAGAEVLDAVWMGVPVVALNGANLPGRPAAALLMHAGLAEFVAEDEDAYVRLAADLAADATRLAELRGGLRDRLAGSALCDGKAVASRLVVAIREAWRRWCAA